MNSNSLNQNIPDFSDMSKNDLINYLVEACNENSNDQILGYKLRIFLKSLKEGVLIDVDQIKFIS
jgi:hypothetical protein